MTVTAARVARAAEHVRCTHCLGVGVEPADGGFTSPWTDRAAHLLVEAVEDGLHSLGHNPDEAELRHAVGTALGRIAARERGENGV